MVMFHLLKIRTSIDIFKNEKCKVTFGLEYIKCLTLAPSFQIIDDLVGVSSLLDNHFVPCLYITNSV